MKIDPHPQNTPEWLAARAGVPSASEMDALISPLGKPRESKGVETYLAQKLAERWLGRPIEDFGSYAMEQGGLVEERARNWVAMTFREDVRQVGFVMDDSGSFGCSPDGLMEGYGLELKCPQPKAHTGYLLAGVLPPQYIAQVQTSLLVTGLPEWRFVSYCVGMPQLVLTVEPDEKFQDALILALESFREKLDAGWEKLCEINGGPPPKRETVAEYLAKNPETPDDGHGITP